MTGTENLVTAFLVSNEKGKRKLWAYWDDNFSDWLSRYLCTMYNSNGIPQGSLKGIGTLIGIGGEYV